MFPFPSLLNDKVNGKFIVKLNQNETYDIGYDCEQHPNMNENHANEISSIAFYTKKNRQPNIGEGYMYLEEGKFMYIVMRKSANIYVINWRTLKQ